MIRAAALLMFAAAAVVGMLWAIAWYMSDAPTIAIFSG